MLFSKMPFAYCQLVLVLFMFVVFEGVTVGQNTDYYLQKTRESLLEGNCEKAQRSYNVYKELEHKSNTEIEKQLNDCFESKKKEKSADPKSVASESNRPNENSGNNYNYKFTVPLYSLYARDFSVFQKGEELTDLEVRKLFANSQSYDLYDKGMRLKRNSRIPSDVLCTLGGLIVGGGAILHGVQISKANSVEEMINRLDHGDSFTDLDGYSYMPWHNPGLNAAKRESLLEAQEQYKEKSNNGLYIALGGVASIVAGILWNSAMKASGRAKIRKAVDVYNKGQLHAKSDLEMKYGLTGNGVYVSFLF